jgi:capsular polysaccharide biosynthesis protein
VENSIALNVALSAGELIVKAKDEKPTKAEVFAELIRKVLHKEVELEEAKEVDGVGLPNESAEKPRETSVSPATDNRQMVM